MPRVRVSDTKKKTAALKGVLGEYIDLKGYSDEFLANKLGYCMKTFKDKMQNPDKFTVRDILILSNTLQIPESVNLFYRSNSEEILKNLLMGIKQ